MRGNADNPAITAGLVGVIAWGVPRPTMAVAHDTAGAGMLGQLAGDEYDMAGIRELVGLLGGEAR